MRNCELCGLNKNQNPLIDDNKVCRVFWVGLSAKMASTEGERPLAPSTPSGHILSMIEEQCENIGMYRTNLVKCPPLDGNGKLRYPTDEEIIHCIPFLQDELNIFAPEIVFLLGNQVTKAVCRNFGISFEKYKGFEYPIVQHRGMYFVQIHHPSYINVYRRKQLGEYVENLREIILKLTSVPK